MIALAAAALVVLPGCGGGTGSPVADSTVTGPSSAAETAAPVAIDENPAATTRKKPKASAPAPARTTATPKPGHKPSQIIKPQLSRPVRPKFTPKATPQPTAATPVETTPTATPVETAVPVPAGAQSMSDIELEVLDLTNAERAKAGCAALRGDDKLALAAREHSTDMGVNDYFDHNSQDGTTPWDRIRKAGYDSPGAENIAAGYATAAEVMAGWMNSPGHRANILNCDLKALGVGYYKGSKGYYTYWTQDFGFS